MPDRAQTLSETPPILRLVPLPDPVVERLGHRPGSPYVELTRTTRIFEPCQCLVLSAGEGWGR
jgi:hypothetical protein